MRIRKYWLLISGVMIAFSACRKEQYTCMYSIDYAAPCSVAFTGFTASELDTIILERYRGGSNFADLISRDTLSFTDPVFAGDTAYAAEAEDSISHKGFWSLRAEDYRVLLPTAGRTYEITGARIGPSSYSWTQQEHCSPGAGTPRIATLENIHVDHQPVNPVGEKANWYFIYLRK